MDVPELRWSDIDLELVGTILGMWVFGSVLVLVYRLFGKLAHDIPIRMNQRRRARDAEVAMRTLAEEQRRKLAAAEAYRRSLPPPKPPPTKEEMWQAVIDEFNRLIAVAEKIADGKQQKREKARVEKWFREQKRVFG